MAGDICGNCGEFRLQAGERFFDCRRAKHAGLDYGMQVRADTRACEAFIPQTSATTAPAPARKEPIETVGLCSWGETALVLSVALMVVLVSWLLYTCAS
jgi:hypothetical protein